MIFVFFCQDNLHDTVNTRSSRKPPYHSAKQGILVKEKLERDTARKAKVTSPVLKLTNEDKSKSKNKIKTRRPTGYPNQIGVSITRTKMAAEKPQERRFDLSEQIANPSQISSLRFKDTFYEHDTVFDRPEAKRRKQTGYPKMSSSPTNDNDARSSLGYGRDFSDLFGENTGQSLPHTRGYSRISESRKAIKSRK